MLIEGVYDSGANLMNLAIVDGLDFTLAFDAEYGFEVIAVPH